MSYLFIKYRQATIITANHYRADRLLYLQIALDRLFYLHLMDSDVAYITFIYRKAFCTDWMRIQIFQAQFQGGNISKFCSTLTGERQFSCSKNVHAIHCIWLVVHVGILLFAAALAYIMLLCSSIHFIRLIYSLSLPLLIVIVVSV